MASKYNYATALDWITTLRTSPSVQHAAAELGVPVTTLRETMRRHGLGRPSDYLGYAPDTEPSEHELPVDETHDTDPAPPPATPPGYRTTAVALDGRGNVKQRWARPKPNDMAALLEAVKSIAEPFRGMSEAVVAAAYTDRDLLCIYPMGDPHFGMHAWGEEAGDNFDLEICEQQIVAAVDSLVELAPPADKALIIDLGDYFHVDNDRARTEKGTPLDVDSRLPKILRVGVRAMRRCIDRALEKHQYVHVICERGNHDPLGSIVLATCLALYYENNPRVFVDQSPSPFHYYRFGRCFIGVTHGNMVKASELGEVMAADRPEDWGATKHRYWYCGHVHHDSLKELRGCTVETFRTLAAKDAWHHAKGYRSGRDMKLDILHREHGKIKRHSIGVEQLP